MSALPTYVSGAAMERDAAALDELLQVKEQLERQFAGAHVTLAAAQDAADTLAAELASVRDQYDYLRANVEANKSRRAHVLLRTFPVELIRQVFVQLATLEDELWPDATTGAYNRERAITPYRVGFVSKLWRSIALKTPELWSYIGIRDMDKERQTVYINLNIERSGKQPLDVMVDCLGIPSSAIIRDSFRLIGNHAFRWRRFYADIPTQPLPYSLEPFMGVTPLLEELTLKCSIDDRLHSTLWDAQSEDFVSYLPFCLRLRTLTSHVMLVDPSHPLEHLVALDISLRETSTTEPLWAILARTTRLEEADLRFPWELAIITPPLSRIVLPKLWRLGLYGNVAEFVICASELEFPRLRKLCVSTASCDQLVDFYELVSKQITHVAVHQDLLSMLSSVDADAFAKLVEVQHVELVGIDTMDGTFLMTLNSSTAPMWPKMESLVLSNCTFEEAVWGGFGKLLRIRLAEAARFNRAFDVQLKNTAVPRWILATIQHFQGGLR